MRGAGLVRSRSRLLGWLRWATRQVGGGRTVSGGEGAGLRLAYGVQGGEPVGGEALLEADRGSGGGGFGVV